MKHRTVRVEQKNAFHRLLTENELLLTSIENNTPPIGAPKVAVTPQATAAVIN